MSSNGELLNQIYENEETDKIIYSIREDLMDRVMEECHKSYLEKQTIRFIVQCAYDAMVKFLCVQFYHHSAPPDIGESIWRPDEPIKPSPKDSWAHSAVSVRPSDFLSDSASEASDDRTTITKIPTESLGQCVCQHECDCMQSPEGTISKTTLCDKPTPSKIRFSPKSSTMKIGGKTESRELRASTHSLNNAVESVATSLETYGTLGSTVDTSPSEAMATSSIEARKKKEKPLHKEAKPGVPVPIERGSQASVVKLPPIRMYTKFTSKPGEEKKKKKKR